VTSTSTRKTPAGRPRQDAETASAARGMAVERRSRGPWGGMGQPAEKALDFGPSVRRLLRLLRPDLRGVVAVLLLAVLSIGLNVTGPMVLGAATDLIFTGALGRQLPPGVSAEDAAAAARAAGDDATANVIGSQGCCRARASTSAR
jgi:ATP-binding cassette, subfamily B, multidrug efflux pump